MPIIFMPDFPTKKKRKNKRIGQKAINKLWFPPTPSGWESTKRMCERSFTSICRLVWKLMCRKQVVPGAMEKIQKRFCFFSPMQLKKLKKYLKAAFLTGMNTDKFVGCFTIILKLVKMNDPNKSLNLISLNLFKNSN